MRLKQKSKNCICCCKNNITLRILHVFTNNVDFKTETKI